MKKSPLTVLLDLDDVLLDCTGAICKLHKLNRDNTDTMRRNTGVWHIDDIYSMSQEQFWKPILHQGIRFWKGLKELPWFEELIELVDSESSGNWKIVTSASGYRSVHVGKLHWFKDKFGDTFEQFHITSSKQDLAKPGVVLFDDNQLTVDKFIESGGHGVLFPTMGNSLAHVVQGNRVLEWVSQELKRIKDAR